MHKVSGKANRRECFSTEIKNPATSKTASCNSLQHPHEQISVTGKINHRKQHEQYLHHNFIISYLSKRKGEAKGWKKCKELKMLLRISSFWQDRIILKTAFESDRQDFFTQCLRMNVLSDYCEI